ncbi:MAG: GNAT family N-acetyltransferase [Solirubrobacteraceae bacterium]|nr:GNAT family N-acetyltransferase [Solirubrobacteraceae bacterium]
MADGPDHLALHAPGLTLRIPEPGDATALYRLASDPEVTEWFSWGPYQETAEARAYLDRLPDQRERGTQLDLLQVHPTMGPVGITGLSEFSYRDRRAMVGTWFGRNAWGIGANQEGKALMAYLAFELLGLVRLGAYANTENVRSQKALEKVGFQREGILRGWHRHGDRQLDVAVYGMLRPDWQRGPLADIPVRVEGDVPQSFTTLLAAASR